MFKDVSFALQVVVVFVLTFGFAFWVLKGAPVPMIGARPMQPNPAIPSLEDKINQRIQDRLDGKELPAREALRQRARESWDAFLEAVRRYQGDECDAARRRQAIKAIYEYGDLMRTNPSIATATQRRNSDRLVTSKILGPLFENGLLTLSDFPPTTRDWLADFVPTGDERKVREIKFCQGWSR